MVILVPVDRYEDFEINGVSCVGIKAPLVSLILWGHTKFSEPQNLLIVCMSNPPRLPWTDEVHWRFMAAHLCYSWGWLDTLWDTQKVTTALIFLLPSKLLLWRFSLQSHRCVAIKHFCHILATCMLWVASFLWIHPARMYKCWKGVQHLKSNLVHSLMFDFTYGVFYKAVLLVPDCVWSFMTRLSPITSWVISNCVVANPWNTR